LDTDFRLNIGLDKIEEINRFGTFQLWLKPLRSVWSNGMKALFGAKPSDKAPVGNEYYKLVHEEDVAYSKSQIAICLREGNSSFTHRVYINGELHYLECHLWKEEGEQGKKFIKGICRDITSQKLLEEENRNLSKSEQRWKAALENAEQGVWDWDVEHSEVFFSDTWKTMLGYEPHEISDSLAEWEKRVHPDDLAGAYESIQAHIDGQMPHYVHEHRLLNKHGEYVWILDSGKVIERKVDGSPKRFIGTHTDITHLKKVEAIAKQLALVAEKTQNAVTITDSAGKIIWVNHAFQKITKYTAEEVMGKRPGRFLQGKDTNPETVAAMSETLQRLEQFDGEIYNYNKDGDGYWIAVSITPIFQNKKHVGFIAIQSDIDERKSIEQRLKRSERRLRRAQRISKMGHWYYDIASEKLEWSAETRIIHKVKSDYEPNVETAINFYHPDSREAIINAFSAAVEEGIQYDLDLKIINAKGETVDVRAIGRPEYRDSKIVAVSGVFQDITRNKQYERELVAAKEKAEAGSRAKQEFLSMMSHEIRTPLNAIIGLTKLLLEENPGEDQLENLEAIDSSSRNLHLLINDILDYDRIINGNIELTRNIFSPEKIIQRLCNSIKPAITQKGLELKHHVDSSVPEYVVGDAERLDQVLLKLLDNAIKFTKNGFVKICVSAELKPGRCLLHFSIEDSGVGITQEDCERIFDHFTQVRSDIARNAEGSGLGLSITSKLIELQGGSLEVKSEVGKGSTFQFYIPYIISLDELKSDKSILGYHKSGARPLQGLRVLLAEDNRVNVMVACKFLRKWEIEVDVAANGIIAVEMVKQKRYDLILMDLHMPEMGGIEATEQIRKLPDEDDSRIPIIALTASAMLETRNEVAEAGMNDYISKPFNPAELKQKIAVHALGKVLQ